MAGSPVFKFKPSSCKKPKLQRKISLQNANENHSKQSRQFPVTESKSDSLDQSTGIKESSSSFRDVTNRNEPNKSISTSLSSFVFPSKKCAKRKLNFDYDGDTDDLSSLRFSDKNLSLCGFRSKTSSIADQRSLPDIRNAVQSPNKNKTRFSGSYRSSVGSIISCRRKLFTEADEFDQQMKRPRLTSPVLCQKTKSNKKEVKLSLKKKFPGVPNSDSARSGLLLNLAFSKYNLSSGKKEDVAVDFVDGTDNTATSKSFMQYSQIKQDDSTRCRSPVFMAIKKVKRKLNLEDQSTYVPTKPVEISSDDLKMNTSKDEIPACKPIHVKQNLPETDTLCEPSNTSKLEQNNNSSEPNPKQKNCTLSTTLPSSIREIPEPRRHETSTRISAPFSPIMTKQSATACNGSSSLERLKIARGNSNLFKNSKIRSTLRDKIFDLSEVKPNCDKKVTTEATNKSLINTGNVLCRKQICKTTKSGNNCQNRSLMREKTTKSENNCQNSSLMRENVPRNDITDSKEARLTKEPQSSSRICKIKTLQQSKNPKKWINRDSFQQSNSTSHQSKVISANGCDQKFLKSHMNRFLTDCLTFAEQKENSVDDGFPDDLTKNTRDGVNSEENEIVDDEEDSKDNQMDFTIENVDSQEMINEKKKKMRNKWIIDDKNPTVVKTGNKIDSGKCREKMMKIACDEVDKVENVSIIDQTNLNSKRAYDTIEKDDSRKIIKKPNFDEIKTAKNKSTIDEKGPNNEQTECTIENINSQATVLIENVSSQATIQIENVNSQEVLLIENVDSQCEGEPIVIESIESQHEINDQVVNPLETDVNLLLLESQNFNMSIPLKDCILKKPAKVCKSVSTITFTPPASNKVVTPQIDRHNSLKDVIEYDTYDSVPDKIEQVPSASYSCVQFTDKKEDSVTPDRENKADLSGLLDTAKKTKKKSNPNSLINRLDKLLNREKSDFRMWEYEMSKTNAESISSRKPAVFCIEKMWKEYSHLILLCSYFHKNTSAEASPDFNELKSFAKDIPNSIVIILEKEWCPKNLTYASVFRIDPPWKLFNFGKCAPLLMLKPRKISIIPTVKNQILYKDPTIPNTYTVTRERELCSCGDHVCNCGLPDSYQFLIEPLLLPDSTSFSRKTFSYHHFDTDTFNSRRINDVLIKHKLFATQELTLDVQILHCHKDESMREFSFWYFVCLDEGNNICCVLAESKTENILPYVEKEVTLRFTGISPWKKIPSKNVMIFLQYLNFTNVPDEVKNVNDSQSMIVFLLSNELGNVECVD